MKFIRPLLACLALAACGGSPTPGDAGAGTADGQDATALRDAIEQPIDQAKAVGDAQAERDAEREQALEDAGG